MTYETELEVWVSLVQVCIKYDQSTRHTASEFILLILGHGVEVEFKIDVQC
jgi:hypothetical protein